jgi:hypothetical protein
MSNVHDHYLVIVGDVCNAARLAGLQVRVMTRDGRSVIGVPEAEEAPSDSPREVDDTGYTNDLVVGGARVALDQVAEVRLAAPKP